MTRNEKTAVIEELASQFKESQYFYITDCSTLSAEHTTNLRRLCFERGIQLKVVKNTLIQKALEMAAEETSANYTDIYGALKGSSALMFADSSNAPAKLIKEFREKSDKPVLKVAYIDSDIFLGDDQVEVLVKLKSKAELLGDIISMLQSPMQNVLGALNSGKNTIGGLLKTLEERN